MKWEISRTRWKKKGLERSGPIYGHHDIYIDRCFVFDADCEQFGQQLEIVRRVRNILGPNIVLWAMKPMVIQKGNSEPWHVDSEPQDHCFGKTVHVWVGLEGVSESSTLRVMAGSHLMPSVSQVPVLL